MVARFSLPQFLRPTHGRSFPNKGQVLAHQTGMSLWVAEACPLDTRIGHTRKDTLPCSALPGGENLRSIFIEMMDGTVELWSRRMLLIKLFL